MLLTLICFDWYGVFAEYGGLNCSTTLSGLIIIRHLIDFRPYLLCKVGILARCSLQFPAVRCADFESDGINERDNVFG